MCARPLPPTYLQEIIKHTHDAQGQSLLHSTLKAFSVALSKRVIVGLKQPVVYDLVIMLCLCVANHTIGFTCYCGNCLYNITCNGV